MRFGFLSSYVGGKAAAGSGLGPRPTLRVRCFAGLGSGLSAAADGLRCEIVGCAQAFGLCQGSAFRRPRGCAISGRRWKVEAIRYVRYADGPVLGSLGHAWNGAAAAQPAALPVPFFVDQRLY